jgi:hypothetical protein
MKIWAPRHSKQYRVLLDGIDVTKDFCMADDEAGTVTLLDGNCRGKVQIIPLATGSAIASP